jgi:pyridoxine/pyridoxamine 5'-phosphate oxidase
LEAPRQKALQHDPRVSLCFYWDKIDKQVVFAVGPNASATPKPTRILRPARD